MQYKAQQQIRRSAIAETRTLIWEGDGATAKASKAEEFDRTEASI